MSGKELSKANICCATANHRSVRRLGHWTTARRFEVRATRGSVTLDLRSPQIEAGDIEIRLDLEHATVKLLVPAGAAVQDDRLARIGRCTVSDWTGTATPGGRRIHLVGELRRAEVRINRGGVAILSAMLTGEYLADARRVLREGGLATIDDPSRTEAEREMRAEATARQRWVLDRLGWLLSQWHHGGEGVPPTARRES